MNMKLFGYKITIQKTSNPLSGLKAGDVERIAQKDPAYTRAGFSRTIARIKAVRIIRPGTTLATAKTWVESHLP